ncbi:hypothetical protein [Mesorhizobium sp.]|uniref:hypothetical protein n=1 Tax=Mesorhizobium sp. TaxID=1871066 RepID=UPI0025B9206E|nr:hypothetical protein [Mesorhizobium sp.]
MAFDTLHGVDDVILPGGLAESPQPIGRFHAVQRRHLCLGLPAPAQRVLLDRIDVVVGNGVDIVVALEDSVIELRRIAVEAAFDGGQAFVDIGLVIGLALLALEVGRAPLAVDEIFFGVEKLLVIDRLQRRWHSRHECLGGVLVGALELLLKAERTGLRLITSGSKSLCLLRLELQVAAFGRKQFGLIDVLFCLRFADLQVARHRLNAGAELRHASTDSRGVIGRDWTTRAPADRRAKVFRTRKLQGHQ